jgi:hypothetical protein
MALELLSVLGEGAERRQDLLAVLWSLKLLDIETPGESTGQGPEKFVHGGLDTTPWGAFLGDSPPLEEESKDDEQSCQSHWVLQCLHE